MTSRSGSVTTLFPFPYQGKPYSPKSGGWRTNEVGLERVAKADRILITGDTISYKKFLRIRRHLKVIDPRGNEGLRVMALSERY